jgi:copper(I)-binding protein
MAILLGVAACGPSADSPAVEIDDAFVTLPAVPGRPGAAYFSLQANRQNVVLTGISSPQAGRIELHETINAGGVSRMTPIREIVLADAVRFAPGGKHAMLFDISPAVAVGGRVQLVFAFRGAPPVTIDAAVRAPGDVGHAH